MTPTSYKVKGIAGTETRSSTVGDLRSLGEVLGELELAAIEPGDDAPLDGELLDLATRAIALGFPELWQAPEAEGERPAPGAPASSHGHATRSSLSGGQGLSGGGAGQKRAFGMPIHHFKMIMLPKVSMAKVTE
jgi:hypothetical protein